MKQLCVCHQLVCVLVPSVRRRLHVLDLQWPLLRTLRPGGPCVNGGLLLYAAHQHRLRGDAVRLAEQPHLRRQGLHQREQDDDRLPRHLVLHPDRHGYLVLVSTGFRRKFTFNVVRVVRNMSLVYLHGKS